MKKLIHTAIASPYLPLMAVFIAFFASFGALATAYISEYFFNFYPCELCLWQRGPLWAVLFLSFLVLALGRKSGFILQLLILIALCFTVEAGIATYHVGVENQLWAGTESCTAKDDSAPDSAQALREQLLGTPVARCDEVTWTFLGLSMASWNIPFSLVLAFIMWATVIVTARKKRDEITPV